jgi:hypothetical protein
MAKKAALFLVVLLAGSLTRVFAQSATTYGKITYVDFAYGLPFYYGDFWKLGGGDVTYRGNPMVNQSQYNTSSIYAGAIIPINSRLYLRPQFNRLFSIPVWFVAHVLPE